jgi:hypothetical protein
LHRLAALRSPFRPFFLLTPLVVDACACAAARRRRKRQRVAASSGGGGGGSAPEAAPGGALPGLGSVDDLFAATDTTILSSSSRDEVVAASIDREAGVTMHGPLKLQPPDSTSHSRRRRGRPSPWVTHGWL